MSNFPPIRSLILAAGQGTRLRPYTETIPKCLVALEGRALLSRQLETLRSEGISDITVVTGYAAQQLTDYGVQTVHNCNFMTTNMVESLFCARHLLDGVTDLVISYGDILFERNVLRTLLSDNKPIAVCIDKEWRHLWAKRMENPLEDAETLKLSEEDHLLEIGKKPKSYAEIEGQYIGLFKLRASTHATIKELYDALVAESQSYRNMYMTDFLQLLIDKGTPIAALSIFGGWLEVDSVSDLDLYSTLAKEGTLSELYDATK